MSKAVALVLGGLFAVGCTAAADPAGTSEQPVIEGVPESGYSAVGFLRETPSEDAHCGATLIAPAIAITAAHCVENSTDAGRYVVGFGTVADDPAITTNVRRKVVAAIRHPDYAPGPFEAGSPYDVAILRLAEAVLDREPATIGAPETSCEHRYVGYGRSTPGGMFTLHTEHGERKSAKTCVLRQWEQEILIRGVDGGNCWGDSGGPLMAEGKNQIVAVMSRFEPRSPMEEYRCDVGNRMIMIKIDAHRAFIEPYAPDAFGGR